MRKLSTVWIAHRAGELDAATTARPGNAMSEAWWRDCLRDGGHVTQVVFDPVRMEVVAMAGYRYAEGSSDRVVRARSLDIYPEELLGPNPIPWR